MLTLSKSLLKVIAQSQHVKRFCFPNVLERNLDMAPYNISPLLSLQFTSRKIVSYADYEQVILVY